jgi:hypothetical protein
MPFRHVGHSTDQDEILFTATRPIVLNGIEDTVTRPDLADRAILLMLHQLPSMGDTCNDMCASSGCRAWLTSRSGPQPVRTHFGPRAPLKPLIPTTDAIENIVDADPVAARVREIMADRPQWTGSASDLLQAGTNVAVWTPGWLAEEFTRTRWPAAPGTDLPPHPWGLILSSAARAGWEREQSG